MLYEDKLHYNRDIESSILGSCLLEKNAFGRVQGILLKSCFYYDANQLVYDAISDMWKNNIPVDLLSLSTYLARKKITKIDQDNSAYYISRLTNTVVSTANLEYYALILRQMYAERELIRIQLTPDTSTKDTLEKIKKLQDELTALSTLRVTNDWMSMSDVVFNLYKHMEEVKDKELIGAPTGFRLVDLMTGGLCKGDLYVIGARPSVGKSALMNKMVMTQAEAGIPIGIISLEMPIVQIGARMASVYSGMEFKDIYRNLIDEESEKERLYAKLSKMSELPIHISDKTGVNINDIKAKAGYLLYKNKLDILWIDYLQLIETEGINRNYNREQEVSKLSRGLKLMAKEFNIPIVILAQLNRESEKAASGKPRLHNLRESGAIEQDADGVMLLHRDWKIGKEEDEHGQSTEDQADLILCKWRNGEIGEIKIRFNGKRMEFSDLDHSAEWKPVPTVQQPLWLPHAND